MTHMNTSKDFNLKNTSNDLIEKIMIVFAMSIQFFMRLEIGIKLFVYHEQNKRFCLYSKYTENILLMKLILLWFTDFS